MTNTIGTARVDLTNCEREQIHILGHVQDIGCLIAVSHDWIITHVSDNIGRFFDTTPDDLIGVPLSRFLDGDVLHDIRSKLQILSGADAVERIFHLDVVEGAQPMDVAIHSSGQMIVLEFEPSNSGQAGDQAALVRPMIDRMNAATSSAKLMELAVRQVRALTGFDRVMMYRFAGDGAGEVVAEAARGDLEPFKGLRYPASDIPPQARALYERSLIRIIADVNGARSQVLPVLGPEGKPLDMSMSSLRAVSPIHLEYLRNMGVEASMSISVLRRGKLWGLIACHHTQARALDYETRSAAEMFGQLLSFVLDQLLNDEEQSGLRDARDVHDRLVSNVVLGGNISDNFDLFADAIAEVIPWDGAIASINGTFQSRGLAPGEQSFAAMLPFLNGAQKGKIFAVSNIAKVYPDAASLGSEVAGLLAIPVSRKPGDYVVLFRREIAKTVTWAGDPNKSVEVSQEISGRLTPRTSFSAWQEVVRGSSHPWEPSEILAAESLRNTLVEIILRLTDSANEDRDRARERQELLIAELNHRVRNILNLIRGLIGQTASGRASIADFTDVLGGRVHALARAHDQLTSKQWEPASLHGLINAEVNGFLDDDARITVTGPDPMLRPLAFSTLALVVHELLTNSVKYGALSVPAGRVSIAMEMDKDGGVSILWRESGGPAVNAPLRHGFGTAIIERSIPHELHGRAEVRYALTGLEASLYIPSAQIARMRTITQVGAEKSVAAIAARAPLTIGTALIVEDNMIIGMDAEGILEELGAKEVFLLGNNAAALDLLSRVKVAVALLDVNLGAETSAPVARRLQELGVPFMLTTGYGEVRGMDGVGESVPVLQKPFSDEAIRAGLRKLLA